MSFHQRAETAARFGDLHPPLTSHAAVAEAHRCLYCFDAPCMAACPTHIDVPGFIKRIASGNVRGSAEKILDANVLGASCARVCPVEMLCEGACVLHHREQPPVRIGLLQRHAMDEFHAAGGTLRGALLPRGVPPDRPEKVLCIGAGPASLAVAAALRVRGFRVTVVDRRPLPGGLNTHGVAEYKLPVTAGLSEAAMIAELGVEFRFDYSIASADELAQLEREFDCIFLGIGLGAMHPLSLPGIDDSAATVDALRFIEEYKLGARVSVRGRVLVVGAGNTAVDAAVAARRLGADDVSILYRRRRENISAFDFEYEHALREGVRFAWQTQPVAVSNGDTGALSVECVLLDDTLRPLPGSTHHLAADLLIPAIGQAPLHGFLSTCRGVELRDGLIVVDRATGRTANATYFAGGDCVNGGREVVDAVADGKRAALGIAAYLESRGRAHA